MKKQIVTENCFGFGILNFSILYVGMYSTENVCFKYIKKRIT
jgi:hypothetical protein